MPLRTWAPRALSRGKRQPRTGQRVAWCRIDGSVEHAKITELFITEALERIPAQSAGPGDIVAVAGFEDITIGETLADAENPSR